MPEALPVLRSRDQPRDRTRPDRDGPRTLQRLRALHVRVPGAVRPRRDSRLRRRVRAARPRDAVRAPTGTDGARDIDPRRAPGPSQGDTARREGDVRVRHRGSAGRLPALLRLPDHAVDGGRRADGEDPPEARRRLPAGGQRNGDRQHDVRMRGRGPALPDVHLVARLQPDARGDLLHDRGGASRRVRERDARRTRARKHRPRAGRHQARLPRARARQHAGHRPRSRHRRCSI